MSRFPLWVPLTPIGVNLSNAIDIIEASSFADDEDAEWAVDLLSKAFRSLKLLRGGATGRTKIPMPETVVFDYE